MATSHGGVLYYVVQVPREASSSPPPNHWTSATASHGYLDEPQVVTSTPKSNAVPDRSTDSGWDNPFRPDGDLSREADEIVELIKGGKPITPTPGEPTVTDSVATPAEAAPAPGPRNGRPPGASPAPAPATASKPASPGAVELQRATVAPSDASQVEHVVLKKKPKCKCCVIQ